MLARYDQCSASPEGYGYDEDEYGGYFDIEIADKVDMPADTAHSAATPTTVRDNADDDDAEDDGDDDDEEKAIGDDVARPERIVGMRSQMVASFCWLGVKEVRFAHPKIDSNVR